MNQPNRIEQIKLEKFDRLLKKEERLEAGLSPFDQLNKNLLVKSMAIEWAKELINSNLER